MKAQRAVKQNERNWPVSTSIRIRREAVAAQTLSEELAAAYAETPLYWDLSAQQAR